MTVTWNVFLPLGVENLCQDEFHIWGVHISLLSKCLFYAHVEWAEFCSWSTNLAEVATYGCQAVGSQFVVAVNGCEVAVTQLRVAAIQFGSYCLLLWVAVIRKGSCF